MEFIHLLLSNPIGQNVQAMVQMMLQYTKAKLNISETYIWDQITKSSSHLVSCLELIYY